MLTVTDDRASASGTTISNLVAALPGWWVRFERRTRDGKLYFVREAVAAWATIADDQGVAVGALVADGPHLVPASRVYGDDRSVDIVGPGTTPCDCGRQFGSVDDPNWCVDCGAEIA